MAAAALAPSQPAAIVGAPRRRPGARGRLQRWREMKPRLWEEGGQVCLRVRVCSVCPVLWPTGRFAFFALLFHTHPLAFLHRLLHVTTPGDSVAVALLELRFF